MTLEHVKRGLRSFAGTGATWNWPSVLFTHTGAKSNGEKDERHHEK